MTTAAFVGSFDPVTNGHLSVVMRALVDRFADTIVVGVNTHPEKTRFLTRENSVGLFKLSIPEEARNAVDVVAKTTLEIRLQHGANISIKGLRDQKDIDYEVNNVRRAFEIAASQHLRPISILWVCDTPQPLGLRHSSTRARDIICQDNLDIEELKYVVPEPVVGILAAAHAKIVPCMTRPETLQGFNESVRSQLG